MGLEKLWIKIQYMLKSGTAKEKRAWYAAELERLLEKRVKSSAWGVSYSVFDGEELLEASLKSIRGEVDYINVVYQLKSWYGNPADENLLPRLKNLQERKLIDELIAFEPDLNIWAGANERRKRNVGLKYAKKRGCDYFMAMDCDEFYVAEELAGAKRKIVKHGFSHTYCNIFRYGLKPTLLRCSPKSLSHLRFVPFFARVRPWSRLSRSHRRACKTDQSRVMLITPLSRQALIHCVNMHHMSFIRKDINIKLKNSSAGGGQKEYQLPDFSDSEFVTVENQFGVQI